MDLVTRSSMKREVDVVVRTTRRIHWADPELGVPVSWTEADIITVVSERPQRGGAERRQHRLVERPTGGRVGTLEGDVSEQHAADYDTARRGKGVGVGCRNVHEPLVGDAWVSGDKGLSGRSEARRKQPSIASSDARRGLSELGSCNPLRTSRSRHTSVSFADKTVREASFVERGRRTQLPRQ